MYLKCRDWLTTVCGLSLSDKPGRFGVEVETETREASDYPRGFLSTVPPAQPGGHHSWETPMKSWAAINDGSLRNFGVEFVLKGPQTIAEVKESLKEFKKHLGDVEFIEGSQSTSVHVHINILDMSMTELVSFVMLYSYFENLLVEFSGDMRRSNLFALPLRVCDSSLSQFLRGVVAFDYGNPQHFPRDETAWKYSALNFCPIWKHGSVEIRTMRGTTDTEEILKWVSILNKLVDFALGKTPDSVIQLIRRNRVDMVQLVFQEFASLLETPDIREMLSRNLIFPVMIHNTIKDWSSFEDKIKAIYSKEVKKVQGKTPERPWANTAFEFLPAYLSVKTGFPGDEIPDEWYNLLRQEIVAYSGESF